MIRFLGAYVIVALAKLTGPQSKVTQWAVTQYFQRAAKKRGQS